MNLLAVGGEIVLFTIPVLDNTLANSWSTPELSIGLIIPSNNPSSNKSCELFDDASSVLVLALALCSTSIRSTQFV